MPDFVHLHLHSDYSLLRGMATVKALVKKVAASGMGAAALTDQGNLFGLLEYSLASQKVEPKINPILGCEAYVAPRGHRERTDDSPLGHHPFPLVLLAENDVGYHHLIRMVSASYQHGFHLKPRIDFEMLEKHREGLIVLSGNLQSELPLLLLKGDRAGAKKLASRYRDLLGPDHYFLEIADHGIPEEREANLALLDLASELSIGVVATNQVHYLEPDDSYAHEILLCIESKCTIDQEKGVGRDKRPALPGSGWHFASAEEMALKFSGAPQALAQTVAIAERCKVRLGKDTPHMPVMEVPEGLTQLEHLKRECVVRLGKKGIPLDEVYSKQLDFELSVIGNMGFPSYFLIVADFVNEAQRRGILVGPGRGSAAGSLVSYAMGITNLDPIKHGLLFERFLNPERVNLPDIDMDFQDSRREEVIQYIRDRFGADRVCQIVTYGKLKPKAIIKDVARVFKVDFKAANKLSSFIPNNPKMTLDMAWEESQEFKEAILSNPLYQEIFQHAKRLEGLTRQVGVHAAGVIIADKPVEEYVPLYVADGVTVTQYEGSVLEDSCGLIKMDILGLVTLAIIDDSMKYIQQHHGVQVDLDKLPFDDPKTFAIFSQGKTHGVFQFESEGMKKNLIDLKPNTLDDLIAMNAMYRPGPMAWIPVYIAKKHGRKPEFKNPEDEENYVHLEELVARTPSLRKILAPTNLIPIYQEQIMEIGREYAGLSLGGADLMRRAMGKKKKEELEKYRQIFIAKAADHGQSAEDGEFLFEKIILPFAGYGFNKSHAACYAVVAYQTAWLKANYPECFMAALLNSEIEDTDKIKEYVEETRSLGLTILPPDINESGLTFSVVGGQIRYALAAVKGVGTSAGGAMLAERDKGGPFESVADFRSRLNEGKVNKQSVEQLVRAGAFDRYGLDAEQIFHVLPELEKRIGESHALTAGGQTSLFAMAEQGKDDFADLLKRGKIYLSDPEKLKDLEAEGLGFNLKRDPLAVHGRLLSSVSTLSPGMHLEPDDYKGRDGRFAGAVTAFKAIVTKKNENMAFATVENLTGKMECTFFPKELKVCQAKNGKNGKPLLSVGALAIFKGKAKLRMGKAQVVVEDVEEFLPEKVPATAFQELHLRLQKAQIKKDELDRLHEVLHAFWGGNCAVYLHFPQEDGAEITIRAGGKLTVHAGRALEKDLEPLAFLEKTWFK
jgi:DNA polymerase-3 subunit alpha